jgi:hypothetical protein
MENNLAAIGMIHGIGSPPPDAGQGIGNAAYRIRIAWSLQGVLRGYRLEYSEETRHPLVSRCISDRASSIGAGELQLSNDGERQ